MSDERPEGLRLDPGETLSERIEKWLDAATWMPESNMVASAPKLVKACGEALREQSTALARLREERDAIERKYRKELWLGHGHQSLYGDDGEMQCSRCLPVWDYKRSPLHEVEEAVHAAKMLALKAALSSPSASDNTKP